MTNDLSDLNFDSKQPPSQDQEDYYHWLLLGLDSDDPQIALEYYRKACKFEPNEPFLRESMARAKEKLKSRKLVTDSISGKADPNPPPANVISHRKPTKSSKTKDQSFIPRNHLFAWLVVYFIAITAAEALTVMLDTMLVGLVIYGLLLVALMMYSAASAGHREQRIFLTLAFAPLIRLISLSIPMQRVPVMYQYMLVGIPIFISALIVVKYANFKREEIGFTFKNLPVQLLIAPLGIVLGYVEYLVLRPKPLVNEFSLNSLLIPAVILLVFTGLLEELVFRGLMQKAFITELGTWGGLFFVSSVFAVLHFGYLSALDVVFVFCVAVIFGIITLYSGSVFGVTLAHGLTNLTLFLIFPFLLGKPVSLTPPPVTCLLPQSTAASVSPMVVDDFKLPTSSSVFEKYGKNKDNPFFGYELHRMTSFLGFETAEPKVMLASKRIAGGSFQPDS